MKKPKNLLSRLDGGSLSLMRYWKEDGKSYLVVYKTTGGPEYVDSFGVTVHKSARNDFYLNECKTRANESLLLEAGIPVAVLTAKSDKAVAMVEATNKESGKALRSRA
jgi:hypothetical protein